MPRPIFNIPISLLVAATVRTASAAQIQAESPSFAFVPAGGSAVESRSGGFAFVPAGEAAAERRSEAFAFAAPGTAAVATQSPAFGFVPVGGTVVSGNSVCCRYIPAGGTVAFAASDVFFFVTITEPETAPANFNWELAEDGSVRILGLKDAAFTCTKLVIPSVIDGRLVTEIAPGAFAYSACGMTELWLPQFCRLVGERAFMGVKSLARVVFPEAHPLTIGAYAFSGTGLTEITLPANVVAIGSYAFANCADLASVTILGRPEVGSAPFRRAGTGVGGTTVHLDPALAADLAYLARIRQDMPTVAVRTDAVVSELKTAALTLENGVARIRLAVKTASEWGELDPSSLRVAYRKSLADEPTMLTPAATEIGPDGSVSVEVDVPNGQSGFLQPVYTK